MRLDVGSLGPVAEEARAKVESMVSGTAGTAPELFERTRAHLGAHADEELRRTFDQAANLPAVSAAHPSTAAYLDHPVRIAVLVLRVQEDAELRTLQVALLHNAFEVSGLSEEELVAAGAPRDVASAVRVLTIDRPREADRPYLAEFHGAIEAAGPELALVRTLDKLDNLLGLEVLEEGPIRESYLDLAVDFVGPMADRLHPDLGAYFRAVADHARQTGCAEAAKARYDALLA